MRNLLDKALAQLSGHNCTKQELRRYLEKEFTDLPQLDMAIEATLCHLDELHLVNDLRVAETLTQSYYHKGNRFITQALRQKGICEEIIENIFAVFGEEKVRALEAAKKKLYGLKKESDKITETDLVFFLSSNGFSKESIYQTIDQLQGDGLVCI